MFNRQFWKQAAERVVKGFAVAFLGTAFMGTTGPVNAFHLNWGEVSGVGLGGAVAALLLSLASLPVGEPNSPSAVRLEPPAAASPEPVEADTDAAVAELNQREKLRRPGARF